jgi:hypothetical protein
MPSNATPDGRTQQTGDSDEGKEVWYRNTDAQGSPYFFCRAKGMSQWTEPTGANVIVRDYKRKAPAAAAAVSASDSPSSSGTVSESDPGSPASRNASPYNSAARQSALGTNRANGSGDDAGDDEDEDLSDASVLSDVWCVPRPPFLMRSASGLPV